MAVKIRMKRFGRKHRSFFRICATDSRARDGRVIEELGTYDPSVARHRCPRGDERRAREILAQRRCEAVGSSAHARSRNMVRKERTSTAASGLGKAEGPEGHSRSRPAGIRVAAEEGKGAAAAEAARPRRRSCSRTRSTAAEPPAAEAAGGIGRRPSSLCHWPAKLPVATGGSRSTG